MTPVPGHRQAGAVDLRIEPDAESMSVTAAHEIQAVLAAARAERGIAHVALSGGTTPVRTYQLLAQTVPDWRAIEVWFADERCVGPQDEQSNYRLAVEAFLGAAALGNGTPAPRGDGDHNSGDSEAPGAPSTAGPSTGTSHPTERRPAGPEVHLPVAQIHRMQGERGPHVGADHYAELLRAGVGSAEHGLPVLDLIVLGIGPDGHVASLFPDHAALDAGVSTVCLGIGDSPKPPPQRITLTLGVLRAARCCVLLASGSGKAQALSGALGEPSAHAPASLLDRDRLIVIADRAAAAVAAPEA